MKKYIGKRLLMAAASLTAVLFILFLLMEFLPGSPFNDEKLTAAQVELINRKYGLDRPFLLRFFIYVLRMFQGDLGVSYSIAKDIPVADLIGPRLAVSAGIGGLAVFGGVSAGIGLGMAAAVKKGGFFDGVITILAIIGFSLPSYVLALILSYVFGFRLQWFPLLYREEAPLWSAVLPAVALGAFMASSISRVMRSEMAEALDTEYMAFAESRGIPAGRLLFCHALKNAVIPVIAVAAPMAASVITGSLAVEKIFSIPGAGSLMVTAIQANDYNVVAGLAFVFSAVYVLLMLAADILYQALNPRIRLDGEETG